MRLLVIRHAENALNDMMARIDVELSSPGSDLSKEEGIGMVRSISMDAGLTARGEKQADALAQYYAGMLRPYAETGRC